MTSARDEHTADLTTLSVPDLIEVFKTLEAPTISEMDGEFDARLLRQPDVLNAIAGLVTVHNPIFGWRAKAFRPVDETAGRGYNAFRAVLGRRSVQGQPMLTKIASSYLDGRPVYQLDYRPFDTLNGRVNMIDEIRRVRPGEYLGIGTWGFTDKQRRVPLPFLLSGPSRPYAGDIGTPKY
ncbi:hypothetical protein FOS14_09745 [Skermania sp. ID1734]|uniref:hypothetical protein n=1 Tax=Skermania sp. ID1734 TaxID=2597516 RepID=UPI00117C691F|nr:hypothetical protein [Skermania sp. ID1734]TSE00087.1 hypothetical protein FOS14_09745 [Skermania sp. ID1734]